MLRVQRSTSASVVDYFFIKDALDGVQVEALGGRFGRDGEPGSRDDDDFHARAVFGFFDAVSQLGVRNLAHDGVHTGAQIHFHDIGDLLTVGDVFFDEVVLGAGRVTPTQEPIGADDHA